MLIPDTDGRTQSADSTGANLSGGNQQKVVMARSLNRELSLLIASQPTRGVGVGSIEFLHRRRLVEGVQGSPVVSVTTTLGEVLNLAGWMAGMDLGRIA